MTFIYYSSYENKLNETKLKNYLNSIPLKEVNKILRFKRWEDIHASLYGKLLLKIGLQDLGFESNLNQLTYNPYGRPQINLSDQLDFNISHSGTRVVCAFSTTSRIGVDLEEVKVIPINELKGQFAREEWERIIFSANQYHSFYYHWTAKEAIMKADGQGLNIQAESIVIRNGKAICNNKVWYFKTLNLFDNYILQIASDNPISPNISFVSVQF